MADDFQIRITTQGDPKGAEAVAASLQKVGKAAGDTSKQSRSLGEDLATLGSRQNATKDVIEGLDAALKGNAGSLFGVAKAVKNLWEILTVSTPVGRLIQLGTIGATAIAAFGEKLFGAGEQAKEAEADFSAALKAAEALNRVSLERLKSELDAITERSKAAADYFDLLDAAQRKLSDARMNLEIARIQTDPTLSNADKARREFEIRQRFADQASTRDAQGLSRRREMAEQELGERSSVLDAAERRRNDIAGRVDRVIVHRDTLNQLMRNANADFMAALGDDQQKNLAAREAYDARVAPIISRQNVAFGPAADARLKALQEELRGAEEEVKLAKEQARKSEAELQRARQAEDIDSQFRPRIRTAEREAGRMMAGLPSQEVARGSFSEIHGGTMSLRGGGGEELGNRIAEIVAARIKAGESALLNALARRLEEDQKTSEQLTKAIRR